MLRLGSRRSGGQLSLVMLMAAVMLLAAACSSPGPATGSLDVPRREPA
jgi:hypothetical protein